MALLLLFPSCGQDNICTLRPYCDFRCFVLPCISSPEPYSPSSIQGKDACYPPIAYLAVKALAWDKGDGWMPSSGEARLALSLFVAQLIAVILLALRLRSRRWLAVIAVMLSPAVLSSMFRLNPSGWSFALVCVFLCWYRSENGLKRLVAALSLGAATALKISPCIFGVLYLSGLAEGRRRLPVAEIAASACTAVILVFVPFVFFGGAEAIPKWLANASANAAHYSTAEPTWGFVALANHLIDTNAVELACAKWFSLATSVATVLLVALAIFVRKTGHRLLFLGAAMAFVTHHDYGGAYLIPAFLRGLTTAMFRVQGSACFLRRLGGSSFSPHCSSQTRVMSHGR